MSGDSIDAGCLCMVIMVQQTTRLSQLVVLLHKMPAPAPAKAGECGRPGLNPR